MNGRFPAARCSLAGGPEGVVFLQPLADGPVHTEWLFHCFTHGYECEAIGTFRVGEQWASGIRAEANF
jgi:hypothetical protein